MILGVMIESNLVEGRQDIPPSGPTGLIYGQSVTGTSLSPSLSHSILICTPQHLSCVDACLSWQQTVPALDRLRKGVQGRRAAVYRKSRGIETNGIPNEVAANGTVVHDG